MRQETACVLNTAVWTLPGHTVPVSQPDFHLFSCCSESNASSLTPAASLFSSSFILVFITLFILSTWKTFAVSSPLLLLPCCSCVFCSDTGTICNTNSSVSKRWCRRGSSLVGTQQQHLYDLEVQWWYLQYVMIVTTVKQVCNIYRSRNARQLLLLQFYRTMTLDTSSTPLWEMMMVSIGKRLKQLQLLASCSLDELILLEFISFQSSSEPLPLWQREMEELR